MAKNTLTDKAIDFGVALTGVEVADILYEVPEPGCQLLPVTYALGALIIKELGRIGLHWIKAKHANKVAAKDKKAKTGPGTDPNK